MEKELTEMKIECPVCGGGGSLLFEIPYMDINSGRRKIGVCQCGGCGFIFKDFRDKDEKLDIKNGKTDRFGTYKAKVIDTYLEQEAEYLDRYIKGNEKILDIGCNDGDLLCRIRRRHPGVQCCGIEISKSCVDRAKEKGLDLWQGSIYDEFKELEGRFDLIILSQVLEHLPDLPLAVKRIYSWLAEGGRVFAAVPDDGEETTLKGDILSILSLEHINHFSRRTLNRLFADGNLEKVEIGKLLIENGEESFQILTSVFQKMPDTTACVMKEAVMEYLASRSGLREDYHRRLGGDPYVIWGASHMAMNFLGDILELDNLAYIVDYDPQKQGGHIGKIPVLATEELYRNPEYKIVVLPVVYKQDILQMIREMGLKNTVIS